MVRAQQRDSYLSRLSGCLTIRSHCYYGETCSVGGCGILLRLPYPPSPRTVASGLPSVRSGRAGAKNFTLVGVPTRLRWRALGTRRRFVRSSLTLLDWSVDLIETINEKKLLILFNCQTCSSCRIYAVP